LALTKANAEVAIVSNSSIGLARDLADEIRKTSGRALAIRADVTKSKEVDRVVEETLQHLGRIDILVNNAGIVKASPVIHLKEEDWDAILDVNAKGAFLFSKAVAKYMMAQRSGRIINVASDAGKTGEPFIAAYCASKFAVVGFTQAFALEMAPYNINVNAVCPCYVKTEMLDYVAKERSKIESASLDEIWKVMAAEIPLG
jgi:NAD(P)-dependent dehydrogenase (short-subunit alcohol dehydrogenase family)